MTRSLEVFITHDQHQWSDFGIANFRRFADEWAAKAVSPSVACDLIEDFVAQTFASQEVTLIGHNIGFDVAFLRKLANQGNRDQLRGISHRLVDTHTLLYLLNVWGIIPPKALSSDGAFEHFGIVVDLEKRHSALHDAIATRQLFLKLLDCYGELIGSYLELPDR